MLTIEFDLDRITLAQTGYLSLGTRRGTHLANRVRVMRDALRHAARRFGERQAVAAEKGPPLLADGRQETLEETLFGPMAKQGWPRRGAAVLHGLHLPGEVLLSAEPCCDGGPDLCDLDPESYVTRLDDGPPQERSYGDTTAMVVYFAPLEQLWILWIGAEANYSSALANLRQEAQESWRTLVPDYADWLEQACQAAQGAA